MPLEPARSPTQGRRRTALPRSIWALGFVSMLMDVSSEMIHSLLPVFLVSILGASAEMVGLIEGAGEATASVSKLFSGWLSDRLGRRKALTVIGYGLGAAAKPLFAIAATPLWVLVARLSDRVGKGIRGAPRDALIGDIVGSRLRGAAYGLRQSLDTVGALAGPLIALILMESFHDDYRLVFLLAIVPGAAAVLVLVSAVEEPASAVVPRQARPPIRAPIRAPIETHYVRLLGRPYWTIVGISSILTLARFSEAFLLLRARSVGLQAALVPLALVVMNAVYAASAYPVGALSDRIGRERLLTWGVLVLILADVTLAFAGSISIVMVGVALWGLHLGMTQGLFSALVADAASAELRGTAFGLFNFATGVMLLLASLAAGFLWQTIGPAATFLAGAATTAAGLAGWLTLMRHPRAA